MHANPEPGDNSSAIPVVAGGLAIFGLAATVTGIIEGHDILYVGLLCMLVVAVMVSTWSIRARRDRLAVLAEAAVHGTVPPQDKANAPGSNVSKSTTDEGDVEGCGCIIGLALCLAGVWLLVSFLKYMWNHSIF